MPSNLTDAERYDVCGEALDWIGTPYTPKARVKGVGVDCGGIIYELFNPVVGPFEPYPQYNEDFALHCPYERYLEFIMAHVRPVIVPKFGDITLFHLGLVYAHAAVLMPDGDYVHAWGRRRQGRVSKDPVSKMMAMQRAFGKGYPLKHFEAVHNG